MKRSGLLLLFPLFLLLAACSTPGSRADRYREQFDSWPPEVQDNVMAGRIDIGYTTEQVWVAIGEPDRVSTRTDPDGTSETWHYRSKEPRFSWGIGVGTGGRNSSVGVGVGTGREREVDYAVEVTFDRGQVSSIETMQ